MGGVLIHDHHPRFSLRDDVILMHLRPRGPKRQRCGRHLLRLRLWRGFDPRAPLYAHIGKPGRLCVIGKGPRLR